LDSGHRKHTKGITAQIIETGYFGIPPNSNEGPDFDYLDIELKVSPLKYVASKGLITTKERNVLGMVDYYDVHKTPKWADNRRLACKLGDVLFVFYLHDNSKPAEEWLVVSVFLWSPNEEERGQIQKDYDIIREKVQNGLPNSEGHNEFLATCPKSARRYINGSKTEIDPSSQTRHPTMRFGQKRGFCIRNKPLITLVARYGLGIEPFKNGTTLGIPPKKFPALKDWS
jgi:DNA mismatch repair protein MutH